MPFRKQRPFFSTKLTDKASGQKKQLQDTSWEKVSGWYGSIVGQRGQYYHQHVILPALVKLLPKNAQTALLDIGCGQGILARSIPKTMDYVGIDGSNSLILEAKQYDKSGNHQYFTADATKPLPIAKKDFDAGVFLLSLQNMRDGKTAIKNAVKHIRPGGSLYIVLNHPCFRIPRQSSWEIDSNSKVQYRRIDRYMTPMEIPVTAHPGKQKGSPVTWSYHEPISKYMHWLKDAQCVMTNMLELTSDKESVGKAAAMENRGRQEFPLFLLLVAEKRV